MGYGAEAVEGEGHELAPWLSEAHTERLFICISIIMINVIVTIT